MKPTETLTSSPPAQHAADPGSILHHLYASVAATLLLIILCCGLYPLAIYAIAQLAFPHQANGSLLDKNGHPTTDTTQAVASALLGQNFTAPGYFHPRPSAAGNGYDAANSAGTNLGPLSDKLLNGIHNSKNPDGTPNPSADFDGIKDLAIAYRKENNLPPTAQVPADAVTRSASGLDPHISPANAQLQLPRVAAARNISENTLHKLIENATDPATFGTLGDPGINLVKLNLSLDATAPIPPAPTTAPTAKP